MNEHIANYLEQYIHSKGKPEYAVFISGAWGSGKSFFVSTFIESLDKVRITKREIAKMSVYGVSSFGDLDEKMYQAMHPVLSSQAVQALGTFAKTALRLGANFDINNDGKSDGSITFGGTPRRKKIQLDKLKKRLLIVDDLERSNLDVSLIFGYFSEMILEQDVRVIFIGNEEKIHGSDGDKRNYYLTVREKIIGVDFAIQPNLEDALLSFGKELEIKTNQAPVLEELAKVLASLKFDNLRSVRQCMYHLRYFLPALPLETAEAVVREVIAIYAALYLQKASGTINREQVLATIGCYSRYGISYAEMEKTRKKELEGSFAFMFLKVPLLNCWTKIVFDGWISAEYITEQLKLEEAENSQETMNSLFRMMNTWRDADEEQYASLLQEARDDFSNGRLLHPGEVLHYFSTLCFFSQNQLIEETTLALLAEVLAVVDKYRDSIVAIRDWEMLHHGYGGWGFNFEVPHFGEVKSKLVEVCRTQYNRTIQTNVFQILEKGDAGIEEMVQCLSNRGTSVSYFDVPLLALIGKERFLMYFDGLSGAHRELIIECLSDRYGKKYSNGMLRPEYYPDTEVVEAVVKDLFGRLLVIQGSPQSFLKDRQRVQLQEIARYMRKFFPVSAAP